MKENVNKELKKAHKDSSEEENLKDSSGDENVDNVKDKNENFNESMRIKILQQNIKRDENNLINIEEKRIDLKFHSQIVQQDKVDENLRNSTIEKLRKNLDTSNIFENISEISRQDDNYIDRGVKTSIFESENNRNSNSQINEKEIIKERIDRKNRIMHKNINREDNNKFKNSNKENSMLNDFSNSNIISEEPSLTSKVKISRAKELGDVFFQKILNAQENEEIILPEEDIEIRYLSISKPINLKGRSGYELVITEGPIIINLRENRKREVVKFSEIKIIFKYSVVDQNFKNSKRLPNKIKPDDKKIPLFRINPGSILFLEDCDISCEKYSSNFPFKLVCFIVNTIINKKESEKKEQNMIQANNNNNTNKININTTYSMLNKDSTKIKLRETSNNNNILINNNLNSKNNTKLEPPIPKGNLEKAANIIKENDDLNKIDINFRKPKKENQYITIENPDIINKKGSEGKKQENQIIINNNNNHNTYEIGENENYNKISILNLVSTRISNFYQAIRSDSSIFNIEKSSFNNILGKALVFINPLFLKISECLLEYNIDDTIHIRYFKTENFASESRKLIFEKNEINYNKANGIYIEGDNTHIDLDFYVLNNAISKNKFDGIFITDLSLNFLLISENKLLSNNMNGININKVSQKFNSLQILSNLNKDFILTNRENPDNANNLNFLIIKNNELKDNEGLGLFLNDAKAIVHSNLFYKNRNNGMFLSTINFLEIFGKKPSSGSNINDLNKRSSHNNINIQNQYNSNFNNTSTREKTASNASFFNNNFGLSIINECSFIKNSGNGLKIYNYSDIVYITNCNFAENFENGILIEDDPLRINSSLSEEHEKSQNKNIILKSDIKDNVIENKNNPIYNPKLNDDLEKSNLLLKKIERFKNQDFSNINNWLDNIIKKINSMFANEDTNNLVNTNLINFDFNKFLKDNIPVYEKLNYNFSLNVSNLQKIFCNIFQTINENSHLIPKEFRNFNIPYACLSFSKLESNSKSGVCLANYFLLLEGTNISDNGEFAVLITKEEYKNFYKEIQGKKNTIDADIGGPWGTAKSSSSSCNCFNTRKSSVKKKNNQENNNGEKNNNNKSKNTGKHNKKNCCIY